MKAEIIIGIISGLTASGLVGSLLLFLLKDIYAQIKELKENKADKCLCEERHTRINEAENRHDSIAKDIYEKINQMARDIAVIAASLKKLP